MTRPALSSLSVLFVSLLALTLGACAVAPEKLKPEKLSTIERIGVVSLVQNKLSATRATGVLIFSNEHYSYSVEDWRLQQQVEQIAVDFLAKSGRYEIVPLDYDGAAIWQQYIDDNGIGGVLSPYVLYSNAPLAEYLRPVVEGKELEAVLVVYPGFQGPLCEGGDACNGYGEYGFGVLLRKTPWRAEESLAYVSIKMDLLDIATLRPAAHVKLNKEINSSFSKVEPTITDYVPVIQQNFQTHFSMLMQNQVKTGLLVLGLI